jgi:hypothetical protein
MSAKGKEILTDLKVFMLLFGHYSSFLNLNLKRSDWLPPYDEEGVTEILKDIEDVHSSLSETLGYGKREEDDINNSEEDPIRTLTDSEKVKAWYLNDCLQRNCRYLNRYGNIHARMNIKVMRAFLCTNFQYALYYARVKIYNIELDISILNIFSIS